MTAVYLPKHNGPLIMLNTTTLNKGGALQISLNFILQVLKEPGEFQYCYAISSPLANELDRAGVKIPEQAEIFPVSPARSNEARRRLRNLADRWNPAGVFTFAGPAYVKFKQPHLLGCMACWTTHAGLTAYKTLDFPKEWGRTIVENLYKTYWFRQADMWHTETEQSRQGIARRFFVSADKVHVISNSCGMNYFANEESVRPWPGPDKKLRIFTFTAPYKHKNLPILPKVAAELRKLEPNREFEIVLTLPPTGLDWAALQRQAEALGVEKYIVNHGQVPVADGPAMFKTCDLLLLPTVLETFSGTYPESMAMGLPIVTTDLDFAHEICQDAAVFYSPFDALGAARQIQRVWNDQKLWEQLIANGKRRLKDFPRPEQRKDLYLELLRKLIQIKR